MFIQARFFSRISWRPTDCFFRQTVDFPEANALINYMAEEKTLSEVS
jgi:hypothetical protein